MKAEDFNSSQDFFAKREKQRAIRNAQSVKLKRRSKNKKQAKAYKELNKEREKAWRLEQEKNNPGKYKLQRRRINWKREYGLYLPDIIEMLSNQNDQCNGCGVLVTWVDCSVDHVIPKARGGVHGKPNYQLLCCACNIAKSDQTMNEFLVLTEKVYKFQVKRTAQLEFQGLEAIKEVTPLCDTLPQGIRWNATGRPSMGLTTAVGIATPIPVRSPAAIKEGPAGAGSEG